MMRYGSVCSGIEAASVAWESLGWRPAWFAEIEPFPCAVLAHYWPHVSNLGDMTKITDEILAGSVDAPDVLVGGTPCQAFSIAGLRSSLADARGQLSVEFVRIANAIDHIRRNHGQRPATIVWENVPGVLNTDDNAFGCFIGALAGCDTPILHPQGCSWPDAGLVVGPDRTIVWRILDAQYFGLAQRRRRVFVVASADQNFDTAAVLLEFDGLRRDSAPRREPAEEASTNPGQGITCDGSGISGTVTSKWSKGTGGPSGDEHYNLIAQPLHADRVVAQPQNADSELAEYSVAYRVAGDGGAYEEGDLTAPITTGTDQNAQLAVSVSLRGRQGGAVAELGDEIGNTLRASQGGGDKPYVLAMPPVTGTLCASAFTAGAGGRVDMAGSGFFQVESMRVRRLMPVECERLQGFPDNWTQIPWRGRPAVECADGPRYKALGNSMAVPVMKWIGERITREAAA